MEKKTITISLRRFILIVVAAVVLFVGGIGFVLYRAGFALQWSQNISGCEIWKKLSRRITIRMRCPKRT